MFRLNAQVIIRAKVKEVQTMLLFIAMHYQGYTSLEVKGQWGLLLPPCLLITAVQQPGTSVFHLGWSAPPQVSSGCAGSPSPTTPVLCHGPVQWSPPSGLSGAHAPLQLISPSSPSCRHPSVPSVSSPASVWSLWCRLGRSCRGYDIPHWICLPGGNVSFTSVNIERRVLPELKTTLMLNFLQTCLMSSLIPAT